MEAKLILFGSVRAEMPAGGSVAIRTQRGRAILALLAEGARPLPRVHIVEKIWGEADLAVGLNRLSTELSYLRSAFRASEATDPIIASRQEIELRMESDLREARAALAQAIDPNQSVPDRLRALERAVQLGAGRLLEGLDYDWAEGANRRFEDELLAAAIHVSRAYRERGDSVRGFQALRLAARRLPPQEALYLPLLRLAVEAKRSADAIHIFEQYRNHQEELGIDSLPEAHALVDHARRTLSRGGLRTAQKAPPQTRKLTPARPHSRFFGRDEERGIALDLTRRERSRLVTIVGFGGVGKSRLAREVVADLNEREERSPVWVPLDGYTSPESIWTAVGGAIGIYGPTEATVLDALSTSTDLLVIDNAEHLIPAAVPYIRKLLDGCPQISLLVTSRVPLRLDGEQLIRLGPLESEGESLFRDRFEAAHPGRELDAGTLEAIGSSIRRLGGIPLAIEMVAASVPAELIHRLPDLIGDVPHLSSGRVDHAGRHELLSDVIDSTLHKLSEPARRMLGRLWVLDAGFTWETARDAAEGPVAHAMSALRELQDFSIVYAVETRRGHRFMVLRIVREVMQNVLPLPDQREAVSWAAGILNRDTCPEACLGYVSLEITRNAVAEADNLVALALHAQRCGMYDLAADVLTPHSAAFRLSDHIPMFVRLEGELEPHIDITRRLQFACMLSALVLTGKDQETWPTHIIERFLRLAEESGDRRYIPLALMSNAHRTMWHYEDHIRGVEEVERALEIGAGDRSPYTGALLEIFASETLQGTSDFRRALEIIERAKERHGLRPGMEEVMYCSRFASASTQLGLYGEAIAAARRLREISWESEILGNYCHSYYLEGFALLREGRYAESLPILEKGVDETLRYVRWDQTGIVIHRLCIIYSLILLGRAEEAREVYSAVMWNFSVEAMFGIFAGETERGVRCLADVYGRGNPFTRLDTAANLLDYGGPIAQRLGNGDLASRLAGHADAMREECGALFPVYVRLARGDVVPTPYPAHHPNRQTDRNALLAEAATFFRSHCPE